MLNFTGDHWRSDKSVPRRRWRCRRSVGRLGWRGSAWRGYQMKISYPKPSSSYSSSLVAVVVAVTVEEDRARKSHTVYCCLGDCWGLNTRGHSRNRRRRTNMICAEIYRDIVYYKILANRFCLVMLYYREKKNNILLIFLARYLCVYVVKIRNFIAVRNGTKRVFA